MNESFPEEKLMYKKRFNQEKKVFWSNQSVENIESLLLKKELQVRNADRVFTVKKQGPVCKYL